MSQPFDNSYQPPNTFVETWKCFQAPLQSGKKLPRGLVRLFSPRHVKNLFRRLERIQSGKLKNTFTHVNWKSKHDSLISARPLRLGDGRPGYEASYIMLMVKNYDEQFSIVFERHKKVEGLAGAKTHLTTDDRTVFPQCLCLRQTRDDIDTRCDAFWRQRCDWDFSIIQFCVDADDEWDGKKFEVCIRP